jgi:low temperature requirement protein LtrA
MSAGVIAAAVFGTAIAGALWWLYFDVVAIVATRRLAKASEGRERNEMARDSYSYLHLPMVASIVLVALGLKKTLAHVGAPLGDVPAAAMLGGGALYLLAHVAFRWRNLATINYQRVVGAGLLGVLLAVEIELKPTALLTLAALAVLLWALIAYEARRFAERRQVIRHQLAREPLSD